MEATEVKEVTEIHKRRNGVNGGETEKSCWIRFVVVCAARSAVG